MKEKKIDHNNPNIEWDFKGERPTIVLGENHDGSRSTLMPWVDVGDGVQVHPDRVKTYLERRKEMGL